jgi:hypothetical protein
MVLALALLVVQVVVQVVLVLLVLLALLVVLLVLMLVVLVLLVLLKILHAILGHWGGVVGFDNHVRGLQQAYSLRRDALLSAMGRHLREFASFEVSGSDSSGLLMDCRWLAHELPLADS